MTFGDGIAVGSRKTEGVDTTGGLVAAFSVTVVCSGTEVTLSFSVITTFAASSSPTMLGAGERSVIDDAADAVSAAARFLFFFFLFLGGRFFFSGCAGSAGFSSNAHLLDAISELLSPSSSGCEVQYVSISCASRSGSRYP